VAGLTGFRGQIVKDIGCGFLQPSTVQRHSADLEESKPQPVLPSPWVPLDQLVFRQGGKEPVNGALWQFQAFREIA
jgi:hypothetical protein